MRFASLGSGSEGNALLISAGSGNSATHLMLDCGFVLREVEKRMARLQLNPSELSGILVTHEHSDHVGGVFKLARRYKLPVWLSHGTWDATRQESDGVDVRICRDGEALAIGELEIRPFTVPHDSREPLQYVASDGIRKLGVLTDIGQTTPHVRSALSGCDALLLEFNHDSVMLANSAYPPFLKSRIAGPLGHLSNEHSAQLLSSLDRSKLKRLVAAHLSKQNNSPELVQLEIDKIVDKEVEVVIAGQDQGFDWLDC